MLSLEPKDFNQKIEGQKIVSMNKISPQERRRTSGNHGKHGN
jgi:hypothetical protein